MTGARRQRPKSRGHGGRPQASEGPKRERLEELHPLSDPPEIESFEHWDLGEEIQNAIRQMDIVKPTPIQSLAIGPVLEGRDVIAKAETGTGKTLAFGAPIMARIDPARSSVLALVLCPTRELAQQVADVLQALAFPRGIRVALVVGGDPMHPQIAMLQAGAQVVVGTPGRVLDLYDQRFLTFPWTEFVVLDEADKMFEIGFLDDVKRILKALPQERTTHLFSATFPSEVLKLARSETTNPVEVATARGNKTVSSIDQSYIRVDDEDRPDALVRLFSRSDAKDVFLVFLDRRTEVDRLLRRLERTRFTIKALHGGYDQPSRTRVMSAFRTGEVKALLATDVASRGLDVEHVTHVINFSVPRDLEDYTHRIGRTGRAGRSGTAITFLTSKDKRRWTALTEQGKLDIHERTLDERPRRSSRTDAGDDERPRRGDREAGTRDARRGSDQGEGGRRRSGSERGRSRTESDTGRAGGRGRSNDERGGGPAERERKDASATGERDESRSSGERDRSRSRSNGERSRGRGRSDGDRAGAERDGSDKGSTRPARSRERTRERGPRNEEPTRREGSFGAALDKEAPPKTAEPRQEKKRPRVRDEKKPRTREDGPSKPPGFGAGT